MTDQPPEQPLDLTQLSKPPQEYSADEPGAVGTDPGDKVAETVLSSEAFGDAGFPAVEEPAAEPDAEPSSDPPTAKESAEPVASLRWDGFFLLLLLAVGLLRVGYLYLAPLDLSPAESTFWSWSRHLDFGYFDHFPLIAWTSALATKLLGSTPQAVRMPAVVLGLISIVGMYLCGRKIFNAEVAFWGVTAWLATPGNTILGFFLSPDALLLACWCLAMYTLWHASETPKVSPLWWISTLVLVGLGSLGHPLMTVFPPLMILYLLFGQVGRNHLRQRWPWLLWAGSLLFLLPVVWWNFRHGWSNFHNLPVHFPGVAMVPLERLKALAGFVGQQLSLQTPVTWTLLVLLILFLLPGLFRWSQQTRFLFCFGGLGLLVLTGLSLFQSVPPGWPAIFYPAGLLLLAAWARGRLEAIGIGSLRRWFLLGLKLGVILTLIIYLLPFVTQWSFLPLGKTDPTFSMKGWRTLGGQIGESLRQQPRPQQTFILSPQTDYPSEIAFYSPGQPRTFQWPGNPPRLNSQYGLWPGGDQNLGRDALIIGDIDRQLPNDLAVSFERIIDLGEGRIPIGAGGERTFHLWRGENLLLWPGAN